MKRITPSCIWLTGLSGSGKTTTANMLKSKLDEMNIPSVLIDGDILRNGLNKDLKFSEVDRKENIRRVSEIAKVILKSEISVICAFISPTIEMRILAKNIIGKEFFNEVFIDTPVDICIERDPKGLYAKALKGEIKNFTGIDAPYEPPLLPDIKIMTNKISLEQGISKIMEYLGINLEVVA